MRAAIPFPNVRVSSFINHNEWVLPYIFSLNYPQATQSIINTPLPAEPMTDQAIWPLSIGPLSSSGVLTSTEALGFLSHVLPSVNWGDFIGHSAIQPRKSLVTWKILHGRILVDCVLQRRGVQLCSQCSLCRSHYESIDHLFLECACA